MPGRKARAVFEPDSLRHHVSKMIEERGWLRGARGILAAEMEPNEIRRWVAARRAGSDREQREHRETGPHASSIGAALSLIALTGRLLGWPLPVDPHSAKEDEAGYATWERLRKRLARR